MLIDEGIYFVLSPYAYNSQHIRGRRCMVGWIYINLWNQYLSPKVVSLNSAHDNVYSMQYYVVSLLMTWDCFLRLLQKNWPKRYLIQLQYCWRKKGVKHHVPNLEPSSDIPWIKRTWKIYRLNTIQLYYIHLKKTFNYFAFFYMMFYFH
jgi:hypothetical protein